MALEQELTLTTRIGKCNGTTIEVGGPSRKAEEAIEAAVGGVDAAAAEAIRHRGRAAHVQKLGGMRRHDSAGEKGSLDMRDAQSRGWNDGDGHRHGQDVAADMGQGRSVRGGQDRLQYILQTAPLPLGMRWNEDGTQQS